MKTFYTCEKCGHLSEDFQSVRDCEAKHIVFSENFYNNVTSKLISKAYKSQEKMPSELTVKVGDYWDDADNQIIATYKLVGIDKLATEAWRKECAADLAKNTAESDAIREAERVAKLEAEKAE